MKPRTRTVLFFLLAACAGGAYALLAWAKSTNTDAAPTSYLTLKAAPLEITISAVGSFNAVGEVGVGQITAGRLSEVLKVAGERVEKDEVVARVDTTLQRLEVAKLEFEGAGTRAVQNLALRLNGE